MCSIKGRIVIQMSFNRFNWHNHTWLKWLVYSCCVFPLYFVVSESIYGYFSWVLLQPRFVISYPFNETHKMAINRLHKHKRKKETHNLSDISQLSNILWETSRSQISIVYWNSRRSKRRCTFVLLSEATSLQNCPGKEFIIYILRNTHQKAMS